MKDVVIVSAVRTPMGSLNGTLASLSATKLGSIALAEALKRGKVPADSVDEFFFGNVLSANLGQAPARQVASEAGLPHSVICTAVNKVCSSGLKAVTLGAQAIITGSAQVVAVAGAESMSRTPYYIEGARAGMKMGHGELTDGIIKDGLWDPVNNFHMGMAAEICSEVHGVFRQEQDAYASQSYNRAAEAYKCGLFASEIVPIEISSRSGVKTISEDEEYKRVDHEKLPKLKTIFKPEGGTVTAANASPISDGGAAVILMSLEKATELGIVPIARILGFADAEKRPEEFTTAPSEAIPKALNRADVELSNVECFEINEAFAVVALANIKILGLDGEKVNVLGGAVALGHPLGCSGVRILVTLLNVLQLRQGKIGVAAICNGGGGSTAVVVDRLDHKLS